MGNRYAHDAVIKVGENSTYQKLLILLLAFTWFPITYSLLGCPFIFMNPIFSCSFTDKVVQEDVACKRLNECKISNDFTLTAYADLYCQRQTQRDVIQSFLFLGSIMGLFIMNIVSDIKGRKFAFIVALSAASFGALYTTIGGYAKSVLMMSFGQLLSGFGGYAAMIIGYIIIGDFCSGNLKGMAIIAMNGFWGIAETSFVLYYFFFPQWYNFLILILLIPLICCNLLCIMFLVQSPIFLAHKKKDYGACMKSLQVMAIINKKGKVQLDQASELVQKSIEQVRIQQKTSGENQPLSIIWNNKNFVKSIILIAIVEVSTNMYYYGVQYELEDLGSNFGISILLAGSVQTFAYFSINLFIGKLQRRKGLFITNLASFAFGILFILPFVKDYLIISSLLLGLCRLVNTYSQGFIPLLQTQSFPQKIQSTGAGMIEGFSQIGSFMTPYVVSLVTNSGQKPIVFLSIFVIVLGIFPIKFIKETFVPKKSKDEEESIESGLLEENDKVNLN